MYIFDKEMAFYTNRPMVDLGPYCSHGLFINQGIDLARGSLVENHMSARIDGGLLGSTRARIGQASGRIEYLVYNPSEVAPDVRNESWTILCEYCENIEKLDNKSSTDLLWLLYKMAFHKFVLHIGERLLGLNSCTGRHEAHCIMGLSSYALSVDGCHSLDMSYFEKAYGEGRMGSWSSIESSYFYGQINARTVGNTEALSFWLSKHKKEIEAADVDPHGLARLWSRYFRIHAILPQLEGRLEEMVSDMEQAEYWLTQMKQESAVQRAEYRALSYACSESRIKEALVLGDFDLAETRAQRAISSEPSDGRLFMHLGQVLIEKECYSFAIDAYKKALLLSPTGAEVAWFMIGQCYESMGELWPALHCYRQALLIDSLAISAREGALRLAEALNLSETDMGSAEMGHMATHVHHINAYQLYSGALGS